MRYELPHAGPGQAVGLLGGSFNPPHAGHAHITREALKRFGLDRVWWLVSPGNPLKADGPAPMERRLEAARAVMQHPAVEVTDIEARIGTRFTAETLERLLRLYPRTRFVWLMGADNLAQFHRWDRWQQIMEMVPVGVLARPGDRLPARTSPAAALYERWRIPAAQSQRLAQARPPAWCFVNVPMRTISSTQLRASGHW
ncbi:nicotinate-nucleotide adenylyltransferase [Tropicimonas aquimaris]|uniref:Probable nicotinate-nucleotide adenylyltransferase n=1 Tax=Tropicimonas aquimaris TaxID=914152 RepID=A0ABW3IU03_9RHOB